MTCAFAWSFRVASLGAAETARAAPAMSQVTKAATLFEAAEVARRQSLLDARLTSPVTIENDALAFTLSRDNGCYRLLDKRSGVAWHSSPLNEVFGAVEAQLASGARD
jgi:hypothetical protein